MSYGMSVQGRERERLTKCLDPFSCQLQAPVTSDGSDGTDDEEGTASCP